MAAETRTQAQAGRLRQKAVGHCSFCQARLDGLGYHFTCHICGAEYCYIHMKRHSNAHRPTARLPLSAHPDFGA